MFQIVHKPDTRIKIFTVNLCSWIQSHVTCNQPRARGVDDVKCLKAVTAAVKNIYVVCALREHFGAVCRRVNFDCEVLH